MLFCLGIYLLADQPQSWKEVGPRSRSSGPRSGDRGISPRYPAKPWNHIRAAERSGRDASVEAQIASTVEKHNVCTDVLKTRGRLQHLIDFETERTKLVNVWHQMWTKDYKDYGWWVVMVMVQGQTSTMALEKRAGELRQREMQNLPPSTSSLPRPSSHLPWCPTSIRCSLPTASPTTLSAPPPTPSARSS